MVDQLSIIFDADVYIFITLEYRCVTVEHVVLHLAPFLFAFGSRSPEFYIILTVLCILGTYYIIYINVHIFAIIIIHNT